MKKTLSNFLLLLFCIALVGTAGIAVCEHYFGADKVFMFACASIPVCSVWSIILRRRTRKVEQRTDKLYKDIGIK